VNRFLWRFCAAAPIVLSACAAPPPIEPERPALLVAPNAQTHEELTYAISAIFNGVPVALANDALTTSSVLLIDRAPARDASGRLLNGRDLGKPEHFQLVVSGARCTLIHERSGQRIDLSTATCKPAP